MPVGFFCQPAKAAAGSDCADAEALLGLARAFFFAGARALLVSHWAVNSDATVKLITGLSESSRQTPALVARGSTPLDVGAGRP
jgi:CHAT domain-containing protein